MGGSEDKYRQLCMTMMDAFAVIDMGGRFQDANPAFLTLVGYTKDELRQCTYRHLTPPRWHALQNTMIDEQVLVRGYSDIFRKEYRRKDGRIVPVELRLVLARDDEGYPSAMWAIVRDITDRVTFERTLRRFQSSVETAPDAVFWIDPNGRFSYVNEQACHSLDYTREELMERHLWDIDPFFPPERWLAYCQNLRHTGSQLINTVQRRKDGTLFPVEVSVNRIYFDNQAHHAAYVRDVTDRHKAEKALQFFQYAIDACPDGVFWMGENADFIYVNEQACRSLGYRREELLTLHLWDIDPTFPPSRWTAHWEEMKTLQARLIETVHQRKDGTVFPIEVSAYRLPFGDEERHLAFVRDITGRKKAAEALKKSEERYRLLFDRNPQPLWLVDMATQAFIAVNRAAVRQYGYSSEEFRALQRGDIEAATDSAPVGHSSAAAAESARRPIRRRHRLKNGNRIEVETHAHTLIFDGRETEIVLIHDVTARLKAEAEKEKLEAQLLQAQKLESIGLLAGGVAHDFNNMLSVILGCSELMRSKLPPDHPAISDLNQLQKAALRSKDITTQLLAFSRKQIVEPRILDPNRLIRDLEKTLVRLIGEDIDFLFLPAEDVGLIEVDPLQIEQILMNLVVNARDALPSGGQLTIETGQVCLDESCCRENAGFFPGDFVQITVRDTGCGMDAATLAHVFDPFFTTKDTGRGTGLGLATVYGIVQQGGGFIDVYSEVGKGTTFQIYLPRVAGEEAPLGHTETSPLLSGSETVMLVEDDGMVRGIVKAMLESLGYSVIAAAAPEEAIAICEEEGHAVDLLLTDVVMPRLDGRTMYNRMRELQGGLKVLYMSGYTSNVIVDHGVLEKGVQFIAKPFSLGELARKLRDVLTLPGG